MLTLRAQNWMTEARGVVWESKIRLASSAHVEGIFHFLGFEKCTVSWQPLPDSCFAHSKINTGGPPTRRLER